MPIVFNYFPLKGLGESIRLLLAYGGEDFEDNRIPMDKWPEYKPSTPFGQMPVLEIDGKKYAQSVAIARYLGHKYGLAGEDIEEDFLIDQVVDYLGDFVSKTAPVRYEQDPELKAKKHDEFINAVFPLYTDKLDEIIKKNSGFLAAGNLTWADFCFAGYFDHMKMLLKSPDLGEKYPSFQELHDTVVSLPKVKEYVDAAPKTEF